MQVKWGKDDIDGYLNFYSISGDGRVSNWTIVKTAMWHTDVLNIGFEKQLNSIEHPGKIFKGMYCTKYNNDNNNLYMMLLEVSNNS